MTIASVSPAASPRPSTISGSSNCVSAGSATILKRSLPRKPSVASQPSARLIPGVFAIAAGQDQFLLVSDTIIGAGARSTFIAGAPNSRVIRVATEARATISGLRPISSTSVARRRAATPRY